MTARSAVPTGLEFLPRYRPSVETLGYYRWPCGTYTYQLTDASCVPKTPEVRSDHATNLTSSSLSPSGTSANSPALQRWEDFGIDQSRRDIRGFILKQIADRYGSEIGMTVQCPLRDIRQ